MKFFNILQYINVYVFIMALAFGLFAVYILMPDKRVIFVYPTPETYDNIQYRDKTHACFSVKETKVSCPANVADIAKIPAQS